MEGVTGGNRTRGKGETLMVGSGVAAKGGKENELPSPECGLAAVGGRRTEGSEQTPSTRREIRQREEQLQPECRGAAIYREKGLLNVAGGCNRCILPKNFFYRRSQPDK